MDSRIKSTYRIMAEGTSFEDTRAVYMTMCKASRISGHYSSNIAFKAFTDAAIKLNILKANGKPIKPYKWQS